jgi:hypothetical protein
MSYPQVVGKRGPKPRRGEAKRPYATRLPAEHVRFLATLANAAGWLESLIDRQPKYRAWKKTADETGQDAES